MAFSISMPSVAHPRTLLACCAVLLLLTTAQAFLPFNSAFTQQAKRNAAFQQSCTSGGPCVGPVEYYFRSDDCQESTLSYRSQIFQSPINAAPGQCQLSPTTEDYLMQEWTCDGFDVAYPTLYEKNYAIKLAPQCQGTPLQKTASLVGHCRNTTTSAEYPSSSMILCDGQQKIPLSVPPPNLTPAPSLPPILRECADPNNCDVPAWLGFYSESTCTTPSLMTLPLMPNATIDGDKIQYHFCYLDNYTFNSNVVYTCDAGSNIWSVNVHSDSCAGHANTRIEYATNQCVLAAQDNIYMKYGCTPQ